MKFTFVSSLSRLSKAALCGALTLLATGSVRAQNFFDNTVGGINLGNASGGKTGGHKNWAIFALSGGVSATETTTDAYPIDVRGNIGIAGAGTLTLSATEIKGRAYGSTASTIANSGGSFYDINTGASVAAQTTLDNSVASYVNQAVTDATNASAAAASLMATAGTPSSINLNNVAASYSAMAGQVFVINLTDLILSGTSAVLTLNGSGVNNTANYVINISKYLALSNGAKIVLGNGLTAQNVLFNVYNNTSNSANAQAATLSGASVLNGIILAPNRNVTLTGESTVFGEVIGKAVSLSGSSNVYNPIVSP